MEKTKFIIKENAIIAGRKNTENNFYVIIEDNDWILYNGNNGFVITNGSILCEADIEFIKSISKPIENKIGDYPSENEIINTIIDCVDISGIDLEDYRREFTEERSGLYSQLINLFEKSK